jgi:hypothetical protein
MERFNIRRDKSCPAAAEYYIHVLLILLIPLIPNKSNYFGAYSYTP